MGELTRIVPFVTVDEAQAETGRTEQRVHDLSSRAVVYLLLAGSLSLFSVATDRVMASPA
ncbi:transposase domain-containing protein [Streptomyces sp. NPDC055085]